MTSVRAATGNWDNPRVLHKSEKVIPTSEPAWERASGPPIQGVKKMRHSAKSLILKGQHR